MDRSLFYAELRRRLFGGALGQSQVDGIENLLNVWERYFASDPIDLLAYNLGTAFHETGATMQPITERGPRAYFNKYEPGTRIGKILGNTEPGDGYLFRGEGHVQNTGRANARKATKRLNELFGLGVDLVKNPSKRGDPFVSAMSLFLGNREGWWTGKDLLDYLDGVDESDAEDLREFIEARRVVNGTDKAKKIAGYAVEFEKALKAAGYSPGVPATAKTEPAQQPSKVPPVAVKVGLGAIIVGAVVSAWGWLMGLPCDLIGVFCQ